MLFIFIQSSLVRFAFSVGFRNGCKAVQLESEESIEKRHNAPPAVLEFDHLADCEQKTAQIARTNVEKCVAKQFPGFVFPPPVVPKKKGVGRP